MNQEPNKFEKARMIGARAMQISMGAPILFKLDEKEIKELNYNPVEIAKLEYSRGLIPIAVKRKMPKV